MSLPTLSSDEQNKLKTVIDEGVKVKTEVADLNGGLKDVVKHVADELGIKAADINRAIKIAHKRAEEPDALEKEQETLDIVGEILQVVTK